ncbi:MAG: hypothetical protein AAF702_12775 [Chloroflexota bacterium]
MKDKQPCFITCLSAPSGGGKTVVVQKLAQMASTSIALYFDEYDDLAEGANVHPESLRQRILDGADYNAWQMPGLIRDLERLRQGQAIQSVANGNILAPQPLVFLDAAIGRANDRLRPYIDLMVYIDTPLDIAMARRIQRDYFGRKQDEVKRMDAGETLAQIDGMTTAYLDWAREAYLALANQVKPLSDLIIDGSLPVVEVAQQVITHLKLGERDIA